MDILELLRQRASDYDCPVCQRPLAQCGLTMLDDQRPQYTVQVSCAHCHVTFVVVLQVRNRIAAASTAAAPEPAGGPAAPVPPISADELLDLHQLLQGRDASLTALLGAAAAGDGGSPRRA